VIVGYSKVEDFLGTLPQVRDDIFKIVV